MTEFPFVDEVPVVLIVEDSRAIASELQRKIELVGLKAASAATYAEAKKFLETDCTEIFLAILDLNLPDSQDGSIVDLFGQREIPSIVFTADFDESTRKLMLSKDVIDYVVKDTQAINDILSYIERLMRNRGIGVLVVDDSSSFRMRLCSMLRKLMYRVEEAPDAETALKMIQGGADIRLALVDYEMPGMNGISLVKHIRKSFSRDELAIIGLSSSDEPMLTAKFIKSGANDFLSKPFEIEEFYCRVRSTVETLELVRKLREANQVKNQFLGMAVHDMRSPISGINGFTQLLLDNLCGDLTEEQRDIISVISTANWQMNELVNDLLDISAIEAGQLKLEHGEADIREIIDNRLRIHAISARKKSITFRSDLEEVATFVFDTRRVGQVLDNLLTNALKYSPSGSIVDITLAEVDGQVEVCVQDYGQGVPDEEKDLLFQSFRKTRVQPTAGESSTGLGLHIVKKIVEGHGGTVRVESEFGEGAAFYFSLPAKRLS